MAVSLGPVAANYGVFFLDVHKACLASVEHGKETIPESCLSTNPRALPEPQKWHYLLLQPTQQPGLLPPF